MSTKAIPSLKIFIAVPSENSLESAELVAQELATRYDVLDVNLRSAEAPIDRLLSNGTSSMTLTDGNDSMAPPVLWVVYTASPSTTTSSGGKATAAVTALDESPYPVLEVSSDNDVASVAWKVAKWCALNSPAVAKKVQHVAVERTQARLVDDAQLQTKSFKYAHAMAIVYDNNLQITGEKLGLDDVKRGKVRDRIDVSDNAIALVTTDRQSGFDRQLALVPYKGAVLNLTSAFWFEQTKDIIPNHILAVPHPYVTIAKKCQPFPIEFVVRSYMTGSTDTSIWKNYQNGVREYCGHSLPEGMVKNQKLSTNLLTPTTKEEEHDRPISADDIIKEKWMTQEDWDVCAKAALRVFALGQKIASEHGLILVDTKYEFGRDLETGEILLIDEVHTPDSSRYWLASSYEERIAAGLEPENIDKEFLRLWFREQCDPYKDKVLPEAPRDLVLELSRRYITLYEMITWNHFDFSIGNGEQGIATAIHSFMKK
jgi:phosphoribosylaminoimidazole-succinocarboxamide synthase